MGDNSSARFDGPGPEAFYQASLAEGEFKIQRCDDCEAHVFYPRAVCPKCGSMALSWVQASGAGTVYSTSTVRQRPERGGDYNVAIVELAEGPRMMSRVDGPAADEVAIGMAVTARIEHDEELGHFVVFDAALGEGA